MAEVDWDALTRCGLYDPETPIADERRALLEAYFERGVTVEEMVHANDAGRLLAVLSDRRVRPDRDQLTTLDLAEATGLDVEVVERALRAAGLPAVPRDLPYFGSADIELIAGLGPASALFGAEAIQAFIRALGMSASRVATASIHLVLRLIAR